MPTWRSPLTRTASVHSAASLPKGVSSAAARERYPRSLCLLSSFCRLPFGAAVATMQGTPRKRGTESVNVTGILYCFAAAVFWAIGPVCLKKTLESMTRTETAAARTIGFLAITIGYCLFSDNSLGWPYELSLLPTTLLLTLSGNVLGDLSYFRAIQLIGAGKAVSISSCNPILVALASTLWLGEPLTVPLILGLCFIMAGLFLLRSGPHGEGTTPSSTDAARSASGFFYAIVAAVGLAGMSLLQKWLLSRGVTPGSVTLWRSYWLSAVSWGYWAAIVTAKRERPPMLFQRGRIAWFWATVAGITGMGL
ncbi:MAG TPA: hypothetical protein DIC53_00730, partial [Synergistaceae bacterium]|nr:hypothetical protein [Synergistaceae bacterium]